MQNRRKKWFQIGVVMVSIVALWGCPPERDPFHVVYPEGSQDWDTNDDSQIVMAIRFTRAVDMNSLAAGVNVIFNSDKVTNADITIEPGAYTDEIVITTVETVPDLLSSSGAFTLMLKGDGPSPVRCVQGLPLDGDNNGTSGGDFMHMYTLVT